MTTDSAKGNWKWIWPFVGATPISQGLDSEMFDRADYPYTETFVREAVQNSLDARLDSTLPVTINFTFHEGPYGEREPFLHDVFAFRREAGLRPPPELAQQRSKWLVVEDFNAKGLVGSFTSRTSDFWNYWLNFGISNKDGTQRGGRGIGRVTFLIASKIQTVLGYTRRSTDSATASCGMTVLRAKETGNRFRSTHAYLARCEEGSVFELHSGPMLPAIKEAFRLTGYEREGGSSGLALIIPYPHDDLDAEHILAASIEHFAPAIMNGTLVVNVDGQRLDAETIAKVSSRITNYFGAEAIRQDVDRYLALIESGLTGEPLSLAANGSPIELTDQQDGVLSKELQHRISLGQTIVLLIELPLSRYETQLNVSLKAVLRKAPEGKSPVDRLFREGMSLPDVKARNPGELDMVVLVDDGDLATYLNFCEGKAHLDLLRSKETKAKLKASGYSGSVLKIRNFVKDLPVTLRLFVTPDISEVDASVFDSFFSVPGKYPSTKPKQPKHVDPPAPPPPPPPPNTPSFLVERSGNGLRIRANPQSKNWPVNMTVTIAYADGSRRPDWSEYDFLLDQLPIEHHDCEIEISKNRIRALNCGPTSSLSVSGFDTRRELDARIGVWKNAQPD